MPNTTVTDEFVPNVACIYTTMPADYDLGSDFENERSEDKSAGINSLTGYDNHLAWKAIVV